MAFRYRAPLPCDFDTEEEYEEALSYYYDAMDDFSDSYEERRRG